MDCANQEELMSDEKRKPEDHDEDQPEVEEVVTEFDQGIRIRSGFSIDEQEPGVLGINLVGPTFLFDDDDLDLEDEEGNQEDPDEAEESP
jgi:hypothetical protein